MAQVLVIDDEEPVRFMLQVALQKAGHVVEVADTGRKALLQVSKSLPDLVITDIIMPDMEGIETIIQLKKNCPDMPIIAISGGGRMENRDYLDLAKQCGAIQTFEKPFNTKALIEAVNAELASSDYGPVATSRKHA